MNRTCETFKHASWDPQAESLVCNNPNSGSFADWVDIRDSCMQWKEKEYED